jgi:hypothetical protein
MVDFPNDKNAFAWFIFEPLFRLLVHHLYYGANTRPGNGVPLVLVGTERVAQQAIKR